MTRDEFIKVLDKEKYSYEIEGDKIIVTRKGHVELGSLTLPPGVEFKNGWSVNLHSLTSIPPDVVFKNKGYVYLDALTSIPSGVEFKNGANVNLGSLIGGLIGGWLHHWEGNIEGIDSKRSMNKMIKDRVFER